MAVTAVLPTLRTCRASRMMTAAISTERWIDEICRQFSEATGWPLRFAPAGSMRAAEIADALEREGNVPWFAALQDGKQSLGYLHFELPEDPAVDRQYLSACDLGEVVSALVNRNVVAARELASRTREVSTLVDISRSLPNERNLMDVLNRLLRAAVELTGFRSAAFFLLNPTSSELNLRAGWHADGGAVPQPRRTLRSSSPDLAALTHGRSILTRESLDQEEDWLRSDARTGLCLRVQSDAGPMGTLWVFDRRQRTIPDREVHVLESIATQVAAVLERAVLLKESETQQRLQQELKIASENQTFDALAGLPRSSRFEAAAICTSHYEVGGDLCELIPLGDERYVVAVGDASGDSIPASLVMSSVRGALRALALGPLDEVLRTDQIMQRINRALYSITPTHQFMSLLFGVIDGRRGTFTYTNAGHPTPLHAQGERIGVLESHGMLLGVIDDATYEVSTLPIAAGDVLVFFSDGISEAMCRRKTMFRSDGILAAFRRRLGDSAGAILDEILANVAMHTAGDSEPDDRTLLVLRVK